MQIGENGHQEYSWSSDIKERILQLSFQFCRTDSSTIETLSGQLKHLLQNLTGGFKSSQITYNLYTELMTVLYKIIGHTRDIIDGKGEYTLAYMQIFVWNQFFPDLAQYALLTFVSAKTDIHPFGSWKDIKYFCNYCKDHGMKIQDPLMQYAFSLINLQISADIYSDTKTLVAKWVPREKSRKFGWIFQELAFSYFSEYLLTAKTLEQQLRAQLKCKTEYRKIITNMNRMLDTTQIKQCAGKWANINHANTTSITITKQSKAFLNINSSGTQRSELEDRIICADNFKSRIKMAVAGEIEIKGKRVGLELFTIRALELIKQKNDETTTPDMLDNIQMEIDLLNSQWRDNSVQTGDLGQVIGLVDFSGSMDGPPKHCATALGIRVAEKSMLGKRVLTFSTDPHWHNLDGCDTFVEMVEELQKGELGYSTNFYKALDVILDAIIEKKLEPSQVSNMILAIFSDMQINESKGGDTGSIYQVMTEKYAAAGIRLYGIPFTPPHMLFWNFRSTSGFPCLSSTKNVSMMSGFSPALLNMFCEKGMEAFADYTPWSGLIDSLSKPRYQCLEDKILEIL